MTTKEKIFHASAHLFARMGYNEVSVRDIAKKVGIQPASIYNHYACKNDILDDILQYYRKSIYTYFPTVEEFDVLANILSVEDVVAKLFISFSKDEFEIMMNATAIIIRERFNNSRAEYCYAVDLLENPMHRVQNVLEILIRKKKLAPCETEMFSKLWVYAANSVAMEATRQISLNLDGNIQPLTTVPMDVLNAFVYKMLSNYVIPEGQCG